MASTGGLNGSDPQRRDSLICFNPICSDKAHGRYVTFQMAEVAVSGRMFGQILARIARLRAPPVPPPQCVPWVLTSDTRSLKALQCLHDSRRPAFVPNAIDSLGRYSRKVTGSTMLSRVM